MFLASDDASYVTEGAQVVVADLDTARAEKVAAEAGALAIALDVRDEAAWRALVATTEQRFQALHIRVNCAGIVGPMSGQTPVDLSLDEWRHIAAVDGESVFLGCKIAIPVIARSGGGAIVNISSIAALRPTPGLVSHGAAKASVRQITQSVALYCAQNKLGIRCNSVHPGIVRTPMFEAAFSPQERAQRTASVPLGAPGGT